MIIASVTVRNAGTNIVHRGLEGGADISEDGGNVCLCGLAEDHGAHGKG
jgi:hypothetical protein